MTQINLTDPLALVIGRLTIQVEEKTAIVESQQRYIAELEAKVAKLESTITTTATTNILPANTLESRDVPSSTPFLRD